tara:strand:+ start:1288 stop:1524 length:237 start_codon:yes stop_codon:yes gene_type:complete
MLSQQKLAQKRHNKKLKRKNKKYSGPKYDKVEQLFQWVPLLTKAGILPEPEQEVMLPDRQTATVRGKDGKESTTSFTV